jgi:stage III sporulation protein AA
MEECMLETYEKAVFIKMSINSHINHVIQYINHEIAGVVLNTVNKIYRPIEEIRMRVGKPLMLNYHTGDYIIDRIINHEHITSTLAMMSENSVYAYQDEIKNGYITLKGGHRVGICGKVVLEGDLIKNIRDISGLNIRICREVVGCSRKLIPHIFGSNNEILNTLIISPPSCGKTTMLRDIARNISNGIPEAGIMGMKVCIVDERSEIAACYRGVSQCDVGIRTDVLDGCPKSLGMAIVLRSMSPQVIITDEIGCSGDSDAVMKVINAGVKIITSAHGYNITELKSRKEVLNLLVQGVFEKIIVLDNSEGPGTIKEIIDGPEGKKLCYSRLQEA